MKRRLLLAGALLASGAVLAQAQTQGDGRPIRLVVPFGAGTSTDIVGRILAAADGQTLLLGTVGTHAINPTLFKRLNYQPLRDFVPLGFVGATPTLLVVPAASPWKNVADLGRATGKEVNFASAGNGTSGHLAGELLNVRLSKDFVHVPYRDGAQALTELVAGNVQFMFYHPAAVLPHIRSGRLRALGVSSAKRSAAAPEVPTLMEQGVPDFDLVAWFMLYAPAGVTAAQRDRLREATRQVLAQPAVREKLAQQGVEPSEMNAAAMDAFASAEIAKWGEAVRRSGAQID